MLAVTTGAGAQLTTFTLGRAFVVPRFEDWPDRVRTLNAITRRQAAEVINWLARLRAEVR
ncbi:hypothetical protein SMC26_34065 [Actinomadura fulvescens]|uniref:Uncharacterized protein n=1 Tax=Actinomadura fulvescens TaxID=46160 RepID=A0ABN3PM20_9ACTN